MCVHGGKIVAAGKPEAIKKSAASLTGQYLSGKKSIPIPTKYRKGNGAKIKIIGAEEHNLKTAQDLNEKFEHALEERKDLEEQLVVANEKLDESAKLLVKAKENYTKFEEEVKISDVVEIIAEIDTVKSNIERLTIAGTPKAIVWLIRKICIRS